MTIKHIDGAEIRTYSYRRDFTEKRDRKIAIALLIGMLVFSVVFIGEFGATDQLIENTGVFISTHY